MKTPKPSCYGRPCLDQGCLACGLRIRCFAKFNNGERSLGWNLSFVESYPGFRSSAEKEKIGKFRGAPFSVDVLSRLVPLLENVLRLRLQTTRKREITCLAGRKKVAIVKRADRRAIEIEMTVAKELLTKLKFKNPLRAKPEKPESLLSPICSALTAYFGRAWLPSTT